MASFAAIMDIAVSTFKVCKKCYKCYSDEKTEDEETGADESEKESDSTDDKKTKKKSKTKSSAPKTRKKRSADYKPVKQDDSKPETKQPQAQKSEPIIQQPQAQPQTTVENHFNPVFNIINSPYGPPTHIPAPPTHIPAPPTHIPAPPSFTAGHSSSWQGIPTSSPDDILEWVPSTIDNAGKLHVNAVVGGKDIDNSDLWIIRAKVYGEMIPGKLNVEHNLAFVPFKRTDSYVEKNVEDFEVLCVPAEHKHRIIWIQCCDGAVPKNAILASTKDSTEPLFIGRVIHKDNERGLKSVCPGVVHPRRGLYITFDFKVHQYNSYEVMCLE